MSFLFNMFPLDLHNNSSCFRREFWERDCFLSQEQFEAWFNSCFFFEFETREFLRQLQRCDPEKEFLLSGAEHLLRQASPRVLVRTSLQLRSKKKGYPLSVRDQWCRELSSENITLAHYRSIQVPLSGQQEISKTSSTLAKLARARGMELHCALLDRWSQKLSVQEVGHGEQFFFLHEIIEKGSCSDLLGHLEDISEKITQSRTKTCLDFLEKVFDTIERYLRFCGRKWCGGRGGVYINMDWKFLNFIVDESRDKGVRVRLTDAFPGGTHCYPVECFTREFRDLLSRCDSEHTVRLRMSAAFLLVTVLSSCQEIDRYHQEHSRHLPCGRSCSGKHPECIMLCVVEALFIFLSHAAARSGTTLPDFLQSLLDILVICVVRPRGKPLAGAGEQKTAPRSTGVLRTLYHYAVRKHFGPMSQLQAKYADLQRHESGEKCALQLVKKQKNWLALLCLQMLRCPSCKVFPSWTSLFWAAETVLSPRNCLFRCDPPRHPASPGHNGPTRKGSSRVTCYVSLREIRQNRAKHGCPEASHSASTGTRRVGSSNTPAAPGLSPCLWGWPASPRETSMLCGLSRSLPTNIPLPRPPAQQPSAWTRRKKKKKKRKNGGRRGSSAP